MTRLCSFMLALLSTTVCLVLLPDHAFTQPVEESRATTEQSCSFGMGKDEASQTCVVPFPAGCRVAQAPGSTNPGQPISKGGKVTCRLTRSRPIGKQKSPANTAGASRGTVRHNSVSGLTAHRSDRFYGPFTGNQTRSARIGVRCRRYCARLSCRRRSAALHSSYPLD